MTAARSRAWPRALALAFACAVGAACASSASVTTTSAGTASSSGAASQPPAPASPAGAEPTSGVSYTRAQAERGQQVFNTICSACHGMAEFRGPLFRQTWMTRPIGDFYQHISTAMPQDQPGSLRPEQYLAVVAYVLQLNGHPAGEGELPSEAAALAELAWPR